MRFAALATDYDGTLAKDGMVAESIVDSLRKFSKTGRKLILVTGRRLEDLFIAFPEIELFDLIVAENGALLYTPSTKEEKVLASPPLYALVEALYKKNVHPVEIGKSIIAIWRPQEVAVLQCIRELGLEHQIIFNKGAVMILPPGINKASGLSAALAELGLSPHNTVGVGDAENDLAFLDLCGLSVAVSNALPSVRNSVDYVAEADHGYGVAMAMQLIADKDGLPSLKKDMSRSILIGTGDLGDDIYIDSYGKGFLITGTSGSGKSTATLGILERLAEKKYQFCLIDPEGDFEQFEKGASIGSSQHAPTIEEVVQQLKAPAANAIVNLLGVPLVDRPLFLANLLPPLQSMRNSIGRPHWIIIDEAHHMLGKADHHVLSTILKDLNSMILITVHPDEIEPELLSNLDKVLILGQQPVPILNQIGALYGESPVNGLERPLEPGEALFWHKDEPAQRLKIAPSVTEKRRHLRKYAEGDVGPAKSFFFTGKDKKLHLRVQNLVLFVQISEGIDDQTWQYHLAKGEYSKWFAEAIKDSELAERTAIIENDRSLSAQESRLAIHNLIKERYTASAIGPQLNSENILK